MKVYVLWRYIHGFGEETNQELIGIFSTFEDAEKAGVNMWCDIQEVTIGEVIKD